MKNFKLFLLIGIIFFTVSCNDFLNIKPKGIQIPEFYDDYLKLLNFKDLMKADEGYPIYLTDDIQLGDNTVDYGRFDMAMDNVKNLYSFAHGPVYSEGEHDYFYKSSYYRIYVFNVIINNVGTCKDATEREKKSLIAEAKVSRAFEYLSLVNAYAKHYDKNTAKTDLGVPMLLSEDINAPYERWSVEKVYNQIFKDLSDAEEYIPEEASTPFRSSRNFLYAYMAKLYLYMGDYKNAIVAAEKVDMSKLEFINLTEYSINPKANGMGRIWNAETGEVYPKPEDNVEAVYARYGNNTIGLSRNIYASKSLLDTYSRDLPEGAVDQRRALYFSDDEFKLYNNVYKFPGMSMWVAYIQQNLGLGTPEFYLIKAESYIRNNEVEKGMKLLNTLRDNRIINNVHMPLDISKDAALKFLFDERRREFALTGIYRLVDMKRMMQEGLYTEDVVHTVGNTEFRCPAGDNRFILPLPPAVLSLNPSIPVYER